MAWWGKMAISGKKEKSEFTDGSERWADANLAVRAIYSSWVTNVWLIGLKR
jgi:hypothetical protein